jgi:polyferredoxin
VKKDFEERFSMGSALLLPLLFGGAVWAATSTPELWWGWLCIGGLVTWFFVVPLFNQNNRR